MLRLGQEARTVNRELQRSYDYNESILKSMSSGVVVMDIENTITVINQAAEKILQRQRVHLIGKKFFEMKGFEELTNLLVQTLDSVPPYYHNISLAEVKVEDFSGKHIVLGVSATVLLNKENLLDGYLVIFQDLTELKLLQESMNRQKHLAALGQMAAKMAHEIRNPMASVMGFASVIDEDLSIEHPHKKYLEIIMSELERASNVIQRVLDFSRQIQPVLESVEIQGYLEQIVFLLQKGIQEKEIRLITEIHPQAKRFKFDREQMKQVLLNMIQNAMQAVSRGGEIRLKTEPEFKGKKEPQFLNLIVQDNGPGMSEAIKQKIFDPFFTTKRNQGTGLGLSICLKIVQEHHGNIFVDSQENHGATFIIQFPYLEG